MTTVAVARSKHASYSVKKIASQPERFVAFVSSPDLGEDHIHRDGRSLADALRAIANHIDGVSGTLDALQGLFSRAAS